MGRIKGYPVLKVLERLQQRFGGESLEKVKAALSEEDRRAFFGKPILQSAWLDFSVYMRFMLLANASPMPAGRTP